MRRDGQARPSGSDASDFFPNRCRDGAHLLHDLLELLRQYRLFAVTELGVRIVVDFGHDAVSTGGDGGQGHRQDQIAVTNAVRHPM